MPKERISNPLSGISAPFPGLPATLGREYKRFSTCYATQTFSGRITATYEAGTNNKSGTTLVYERAFCDLLAFRRPLPCLRRAVGKPPRRVSYGLYTTYRPVSRVTAQAPSARAADPRCAETVTHSCLGSLLREGLGVIADRQACTRRFGAGPDNAMSATPPPGSRCRIGFSTLPCDRATMRDRRRPHHWYRTPSRRPIV
jgi:hypothetical protein